MMRALEVGDRVKTKAFKDFDGNERFSVGTIAIVAKIDNTKNLPICVNTIDDLWWYSADEIELVQEVSAEEVWNGLGDISDDELYGYFAEENRAEVTREEVICSAAWWALVDLVTKHKADHEKKEPEFEWVDICRIIEVQDNGKKACVYEEDIKDADLPFGYKECTAEMILKEYMKSHRGSYFASIEHVCRVKR